MEINKNIQSVKNGKIEKKNKALEQKRPNYEPKDIANSPNPAEYLGRSQVVFRGKQEVEAAHENNVPNGLELTDEELKPVKLISTPSMPKEEAIEYLKSVLKYTDEDIALIDFDNEENCQAVSNIKCAFETEFFSEEEINEMAEEYKTKDSEEKVEMVTDLKDFNYANQHNIDALKKYIEIDKDNVFDILNNINNNDDKDIILEKLPYFAMVSGKLDKHSVNNIGWVSSESLEKVTPERVKILKQINAILPEDKRMPAPQCDSLGTDEDLTSETVKEYIEAAKQVRESGICSIESILPSYKKEDIKTLTQRINSVNVVLQQHPMELACENPFSLDDIEKITKSEDLADVQTYVNSLIPEAKTRGITEILLTDNNLSKEQLSKVLNLVYHKDYGKVKIDTLLNFLKEQQVENPENFDNIFGLIESYKGSDRLNTNYMDRALTVPNGDYKGAVEVLNTRKELDEAGVQCNDYSFGEAYRKKDIDYGQLNKMLKYLKEVKDNGKDESAIPTILFSDPKGYNKMVMFDKFSRNRVYDYNFCNKVYSLAEKLETQDELDLAVNLLEQKKYPNDEDYPNKRFYIESDDIEPIIEAYRKDSDSTKAILGLTFANGNWKFVNKDDILAGIESYQLDKDMTLYMANLADIGRPGFLSGASIKALTELALKDKNSTMDYLFRENTIKDGRDKYRFNDTNTIKTLVESAQIDKEFTDKLLDKTFVDYYEITRYLFNDVGDVLFLTQKSKEDKEFVNFLLNSTETSYSNTPKQRFEISTIKAVLNNPPENKEFLLGLINKQEEKWDKMRNVYSDYDIRQLAYSANINKDLTESLLNETFETTEYDHKKTSRKRFNSTSDIQKIVEASKNDSDFVKTLLKCTETNWNGDIRPRFDADDISHLVMLASDADNKADIMDLLNKNITMYDGRVVPRFSANNIKIILDTYKIDKPSAKELLNESYEKDGSKYYRYGTSSVYDILKSKELDEEFANEILDWNRGDNFPKVCGDNILHLTELAQKDKELTRELYKMSYTDSGKIYRRFDVYDIEDLISNGCEDREFLRELTAMKSLYKKGHEIPRFNARNIIDILNSAKINKEFTKELLSLKNPDNDVQFESFKISNIVSNVPFEDYKKLKEKVGDDINRHKPADIILYSVFKDFSDKNHICELSKTQKKDLLLKLLINKTLFNEENCLNMKLIPKSSKEYAKLIKDITSTLNLNIPPLTEPEQKENNKYLKDLETILKTMDLSELTNVQLTIPHKEFISNVNDILQDLESDEQAKIQDYFGFKIEDNKLTGYPMAQNKDVTDSDITDKKSLAALEKIKPLVEDYSNNNFITTKDNPTLNQLLKSISKYMPELYNQVDSSQTFVDTIKSLQKIVQNPKFERLTEEDKRILVVSTLLHNTDKVSGKTSESAFDAYFISKKLGFSDKEAQKIYKIVESSDLINKFMNSTPETRTINTRNTQFAGKNREAVFDLLAFNLKEDNNFELAQMLYSTKEQDGLTRHLDKMLEKRIFEIKSTDFILPQVTQEDISAYTENKEVNGHNVNVVKAEAIPNFHAFIHTPEARYATGGTRDANLANFEIFKDFSDDKVICTSYVTPDKAALVREFHHGFIFNVDNNKQYVAYNRDIFSLAKNIPNMLIEYYRDKNFMANRHKGYKYEHRTNVSDNLKKIMNISDEEYVKRMDTVKSSLNGEVLTMEKLKSIDNELYDAYQKLFDSETLLNGHCHNEALVSSPQISAIFTDNIDKLPEEYLVMAKEQNLPIVIFDTQKKDKNS